MHCFCHFHSINYAHEPGIFTPHWLTTVSNQLVYTRLFCITSDLMTLVKRNVCCQLQTEHTLDKKDIYQQLQNFFVKHQTWSGSGDIISHLKRCHPLVRLTTRDTKKQCVIFIVVDHTYLVLGLRETVQTLSWTWMVWTQDLLCWDHTYNKNKI